MSSAPAALGIVVRRGIEVVRRSPGAQQSEPGGGARKDRHALLGPNGAGKTTMVRILSTLIPADSGSMRIAGHDVVTDPDGVRAVIGVTGQFSAVDNLLTGAENLRLMADLRHLGREAGRRRVTELLEQFDLTDAADKLLSTYSGGMRRRLDLAMTLVSRPQVIFLDEPTTGLDPRSRLTMWQIIRDLAGAGVTILLTTQYLDEADQLADRIAVLDQGRIIAEGSPAELKARIPGEARSAPLRRPPAPFGPRAGCWRWQRPTRTSSSSRSPQTAPSIRFASSWTSCTTRGSTSSG